MHIRPTGQASKHNRNIIKQNGSKGWTNMGAGVIISMGSVPYEDLGRTLLCAVAQVVRMDRQQEWEADNG